MGINAEPWSWGFTRPSPITPKYIVCNADEGEPGTIKDRYIMEGDPHRVLEGMAIAGYAVGASVGYIYCRGEYYLSMYRLNKAIEAAEATDGNIPNPWAARIAAPSSEDCGFSSVETGFP